MRFAPRNGTKANGHPVSRLVDFLQRWRLNWVRRGTGRRMQVTFTPFVDNSWPEFRSFRGPVVASLICVGPQIRQDHRVAVAQGFVGSVATDIELHQSIIDNQALWMSGLDGSELSPVDQAKFDQLIGVRTVRKMYPWQQGQLIGRENLRCLLSAMVQSRPTSGFGWRTPLRPPTQPIPLPVVAAGICKNFQNTCSRAHLLRVDVVWPMR